MSRPVTGERVSTSAGGFHPTFQRHVAAYARCAELLPPGRVLDLGAGTGHSAALLAPRESVALDRDPAALAGQDRQTVVADMRALPFADASFHSVLAVQSIEHVPDPERAVAEIARVLERPGGMGILVTPNRLTFARPDEIIDPYHYVEFDAGTLHAVCNPFFANVEIRGLFGSERYRSIVATEKRRLDAMLARDPLRLRRFVPRRGRQWLYDATLRRVRQGPDPLAGEITPEDFSLGDPPLDACLDLVAICRA